MVIYQPLLIHCQKKKDLCVFVCYSKLSFMAQEKNFEFNKRNKAPLGYCQSQFVPKSDIACKYWDQDLGAEDRYEQKSNPSPWDHRYAVSA